MDTHEKNSKAKLITTIVAIVVIAGVILLIGHLKSNSTTPQTATTTNTTAASSATVKDGTYNASGSYSVPSGNETITVSLKLADGVVSDVSVQHSQSDQTSSQYKQEFSDGYKAKVVGKKISGLQISSVSGASDTTKGFNQALEKIANEAQS